MGFSATWKVHNCAEIYAENVAVCQVGNEPINSWWSELLAKEYTYNMFESQSFLNCVVYNHVTSE